mmetsp:Transcript_7392/g.16220  ORF Transcript_7392/g.16220 Transcript_7392/m.16220 type:complete len:699 (+) Transcript_7392:82-2178(+)
MQLQVQSPLVSGNFNFAPQQVPKRVVAGTGASSSSWTGESDSSSTPWRSRSIAGGAALGALLAAQHSSRKQSSHRGSHNRQQRTKLCAKKKPVAPGSSPPEVIRNFSIIAHIDHGKSTLADRLLEVTGTVKKEDMANQLLDNMDIERERGITIKLNTARMQEKSEKNGEEYVLNLIDTPGHVDFTYEVSRSLAACEGALLVVDATQGVEAQTLANVTLALEADLEIIPVLNKVDLPSANPDAVAEEIEEVLGIDCSDVLLCSAKTGVGVPEIVQALIERVPAPPDTVEAPLRMLIYDSFYDNYRGTIVQMRVVDGRVKKGDKIRFMASKKEYLVEEIGITVGGLRKPVDTLAAGEVGYLCASIKQVADARVGDTIVLAGQQDNVEALPGYTEAVPMVYCGLFPADSNDFEPMRTAFEKLSLNDAAVRFSPEKSGALGLGFRCGFLGVLHMEVIKERLEREYKLDLIVTAPSVEYEVLTTKGEEMKVQFASQLPEPSEIQEIREPYALLEMIVPQEFMGQCMDLAINRRGIYRETQMLNRDRVLLMYEVPLAEIIRDFFSELKSRTRGYASMDYRPLDMRANDLVKLEMDINKVPATSLAQIVHRERSRELGKKMCAILQDEIPAQQIVVILQARVGSNIIASERIKAVRKDVLAKCYGGDITRKKKLLQKQAEGKKRMQAVGRVTVPSDAILAVIRGT